MVNQPLAEWIFWGSAAHHQLDNQKLAIELTLWIIQQNWNHNRGFLENAGEQVLVNQNLQESSPILSGPVSLLDVLAWFQQYTVLDAGRAGKWDKIHPTMNHSIFGIPFLTELVSSVNCVNVKRTRKSIRTFIYRYCDMYIYINIICI